MSSESLPRFVDVYLEPCDAAPDGVSMRWKSAGHPREVSVIEYESDGGLAGSWRVAAASVEDRDGAQHRAVAVPVEDSSDGTAWLIVGGSAGLLLEHVATGATVREAYLVLSKTAALS